jgi:hypothetical protein
VGGSRIIVIASAVLLSCCQTPQGIRNQEAVASYTGDGNYEAIASCVAGELRVAMASVLGGQEITLSPNPRLHLVYVDTAPKNILGGSASGVSQWGMTISQRGQGFKLDVKSLPTVWGGKIAPMDLIEKALNQCATNVVKA